MAKKEPIYKGLAELSVQVDDRSVNSPDYFRIIKMPVEFTAGVNSIKFKGNPSLFVNESVVEIEVLDSNGAPIYHEIGLDLESEQQNAIVNVFINQDTAPGIGTIYICGVISKDSKGNTLDSSKINLRWSTPINVDISKRNEVDILYTQLPTVTITSTSGSYTNLKYPSGNRIVSQSITVSNGHLTYYNLNNQPVIATGSEATFAFTSSAISSNVLITAANLTNINPSLPSSVNTLVYSSSISSYNGSGIAYLADPMIFKNPNGIENYIVKSANILTFTYIVEQSASLGSAATENSYNTAVVYFNNLSPQVGQVAKIRSYYKSAGVGEYIFSNESDITLFASESGFTPNTFTASLAIPTNHRNDRLDFKFEFINPNGTVSKQVVESKNHLFSGGNTYIGGDDNLLTGSLYVAGSTGTGVHISGLGDAAMIRSIGYNGFQKAIAGTAVGGFVIYSGSIQPLLNATENYSGVGLELVANSESYFRYTTSGSGLLDIRTANFFLGNGANSISGSNGNISISGSNVAINTATFLLGSSTTFISGSGGNILISGSNLDINTSKFFLGNPSSFISGSGNNIRISGSNVTVSTPSFLLGNQSNFISGSGGNILISGSNVRIATPTFFLGSDSQYISGSNGNIEISSSNFFLDRTGNVTMAGTISATAGTIGGFSITAAAISSSNNSLILRGNTGQITGSNVQFTGGKIGSFTLSNDALTGINSSGAVTFFISSSVSATPNTAFFISSSQFNVRQSGVITGSNVLFDGGKVGGFTIDSSKITGANIIIDSAGSIQTADYASDLKGWKISAQDNGFAEFENIRIRGTLKTAVFEKETVNAVGGQLYVANSTTITGSEAASLIPEHIYMKFNSYSGSSAIQNIVGSTNVAAIIPSLVTASIQPLPNSTQTYKPYGNNGLYIISGTAHPTISNTANTNVARISNFNFGASASYNVSLWVYPDFDGYIAQGLTVSGTIIEKPGGSGVSLTGLFAISYLMRGDLGGTTASFFIANGNGASSSTGTALLTTTYIYNKQWSHISFDLSASLTIGTRRFYVDGQLRNTASSNIYLVASQTQPINIGAGYTYTDRFPGYITDLRIYSRSLSANDIRSIITGSYYTASITADSPGLVVDNASGFVNGEILAAKKVTNTGFATEYLQVRDVMRLNPSSDTDFTGVLYVTRSYGNNILGDSGSLGDRPSNGQSYEPSQVIVSTGRINTGFIRINANPSDTATPYIDIVERTGSGIYDVALKARLGDLSGLANSNYVFGNPNPGFGLATDNVFLQGGIIANTGSIAGIKMEAGKLYTGTGTFNNINTGFYLDSSGQFSLKNALSWNGTDLIVSGNNVDIETPSFFLGSDQAFISGSQGNIRIVTSGSAGTGVLISGSNVNLLTPNFFFGSSTGFISGSPAGIRISGSSVDLLTDSFFLGRPTSYISGSGATILISGSNVTVSTPSFFLGNQTSFISGSGGNIRITGSNVDILTDNFFLGRRTSFISGSGGTILISGSNVDIRTPKFNLGADSNYISGVGGAVTIFSNRFIVSPAGIVTGSGLFVPRMVNGNLRPMVDTSAGYVDAFNIGRVVSEHDPTTYSSTLWNPGGVLLTTTSSIKTVYFHNLLQEERFLTPFQFQTTLGAGSGTITSLEVVADIFVDTGSIGAVVTAGNKFDQFVKIANTASLASLLPTAIGTAYTRPAGATTIEGTFASRAGRTTSHFQPYVFSSGSYENGSLYRIDFKFKLVSNSTGTIQSRVKHFGVMTGRPLSLNFRAGTPQTVTYATIGSAPTAVADPAPPPWDPGGEIGGGVDPPAPTP